MKTRLKRVPPTFGDTDILTTRQLDLAFQMWRWRSSRRRLGGEGKAALPIAQKSAPHGEAPGVREPLLFHVLSHLGVGDRQRGHPTKRLADGGCGLKGK